MRTSTIPLPPLDSVIPPEAVAPSDALYHLLSDQPSPYESLMVSTQTSTLPNMVSESWPAVMAMPSAPMPAEVTAVAVPVVGGLLPVLAQVIGSGAELELPT